MIAGRPISSSAASASSSERASRLAGEARPIRSIAWRNSWRSSALAIASRVGADQLDLVTFEHARSGERHRRVERGLAAHRRQQRVGALAGDDLLDDLRGDRLDIGRVGQVRVGHDRRRVRIDQDDPIALGLKRLARLRARIIELARLPDHDRPGADDQDAVDVCAFRHGPFATQVTLSSRRRPGPTVQQEFRIGGGLRRSCQTTKITALDEWVPAFAGMTSRKAGYSNGISDHSSNGLPRRITIVAATTATQIIAKCQRMSKMQIQLRSTYTVLSCTVSGTV